MGHLRIVLADDHGVLRAGLRALLDSQHDLDVVGEAPTADAAIALVQKLKPDLVLVDIRMPGGGLAAVRRMKQEQPGVYILVLSQYDDPAYLREALAGGASGYALKRSSGPDLLEAIRTVGRGDVYLHPSLAKVLVEESWGPRGSDARSGLALSDREAQVVHLIALGHTMEQMAQQLFLSVRTVETYKARAMEKLGITSRVALIHYALEHGLLDLPPD
ncbi:MAG: response regulator transcription factor [Chloroflexota bacterium]